MPAQYVLTERFRDRGGEPAPLESPLAPQHADYWWWCEDEVEAERLMSGQVCFSLSRSMQGAISALLVSFPFLRSRTRKQYLQEKPQIAQKLLLTEHHHLKAMLGTNPGAVLTNAKSSICSCWPWGWPHKSIRGEFFACAAHPSGPAAHGLAIAADTFVNSLYIICVSSYSSAITGEQWEEKAYTFFNLVEGVRVQTFWFLLHLWIRCTSPFV